MSHADVPQRYTLETRCGNIARRRSASIPGYNHYRDCTCGWCSSYHRALPFQFDAQVSDAKAILRDLRFNGSFASAFVNPNALCPVCKQQVFYYENRFGSRVFFDALGKPWPKHPCTDIPRPAVFKPLARRPRGETDEIATQAATAGLDPRTEHQSKYQVPPESVWIVSEVRSRGPNHDLSADALVPAPDAEIVGFFAFTSGSVTPQVGDLFSSDGETISIIGLDGTSRVFRARRLSEQENAGRARPSK